MLKMTVSMYNEIFVYDLQAIQETVGLPDTLALIDGDILAEMLAAKEISNQERKKQRVEKSGRINGMTSWYLVMCLMILVMATFYN